jgi:hypothetical protein
MAFVSAENFIIGNKISSSELSFSEYVRACVSAGRGSARVNCGLEIDCCLKFCLDAGRLSDAKWEDPIGVGEAMAIIFFVLERCFASWLFVD